MKKIFTYLFVGSFLSTFAQLPVSQTAEKKRVVLEEYTGKTCQFCPDGHKIGATMQAADPTHVFLINIHTGSYANGTPNYRTNFGTALANQTNLGGYPSGTINRHIFSGTATALDRDTWSSSANTIKGQDAYVNVAAEASIDVVTNILTVNVEAYYTANSPASYNLLNVALTQDNIWGPQTGASSFYPENIDPVTGLYKHGHMLRHMLTGQWGDTISTTSSGTLVQKTYTYTLPTAIGDVDVDLSSLDIVVFVTQTKQEIINANGTKPVLTNLPNALEVEALTLKVAPQTCDGIVEPKFEVRNYGQATITSLELKSSANNGTEYTHNWTGSILPGYTETITLPLLGFAVQASNDIKVRVASVNGATDDITTNNELQSVVTSVEELQTDEVSVTLTTDQWASEVSWKILDANGAVVYQVAAGTFPDAVTNDTKDVVLSAYDCYTFELADTYGDGGATVVIKDKASSVVLHTTGTYSSKDTYKFATVNANGEGNGNGDGSSVNPNGIKTTNANITFAVYPNPATDVLMVAFDGEISSIEIVNVLGEKVITSNVGNLNVSNLNKGVYFIKLTDKAGNTVSQSFVKK